jgi:hypothetical protein
MTLAEQEYDCEMTRYYCYCENANDDLICEKQYCSDAGMDVCMEDEARVKDSAIIRMC